MPVVTGGATRKGGMGMPGTMPEVVPSMWMKTAKPTGLVGLRSSSGRPSAPLIWYSVVAYRL